MITIKDRDAEPISDINFIPFIDILLVILVVFMIATPILMQSALKVKLPQAAAGIATQGERERITITVSESGRLSIDDGLIEDIDVLGSELASRGADRKIVAISADERAPYGIVAKALSVAQSRGALKLELNMIPQHGSKR
jgi:biopolymer transport protein TolR